MLKVGSKTITYNTIFGHHTYLLSLILLVIFLPLSPYFLSVSQFMLALNWLLEGNFKNKVQIIKTNKAIWFFMIVPLVHLIWLANTTDFGYALHDLKIKVPLLLLPLIIGTSKPLSAKQLKIVLHFFVAAVITASFICTAIYFGVGNYNITNVRQISVFVSHIRFSLMIDFSLVILLYYLINVNPFGKYGKVQIISYLSAFIWLLFFLVLLQALTGWVILFLLSFFLVFTYFSTFQSRLIKIVMVILIIILPLFTGALFYKVYSDLFPDTQLELSNLPTHSNKGNKYRNDTTADLVENGHYVFILISKKEVIKAWKERSDVDVLGKDKKGQSLYFTLLRYLASKGLTKDYEGVMALSQEDVKMVEEGYTSCIYKKKFIPYIKAYEFMWELDRYFKTGNANNKSVAMRIEYVKAGFNIAKKNLFFGIGTGDLKKEYEEIYKEIDSKLDKKNRRRAHNQYLTFFITFGLVGFLLTMIGLFGPAVVCRKNMSMLLVGFLFILFVSMLNEDTLENQAGVTFFISFYSILIFSDKPKIEHG